MSQKMTHHIPSVEEHCPEFLKLQQCCCENHKSHARTQSINHKLITTVKKVILMLQINI